ncbi:MAG: peptidyl-prolyl cis-trans isomerase [Deltaproteobacteria bacterium]|nr:peptidyl-prolyl cis-trans isomerase [Deltaproteobacteria bacterium]
MLAKAKAGEDFSELAKQYSEDKKTSKRGGVMAFFAKGSKDPEFEEAAFNLKKDKISDLVLTKKGYHIIKLLDKKEGKKKTLKEATTNIRNKVKQKKRKEGYEKMMADLKEKNKVVIYEDALAKITEKPKGQSDKK